MLFRSGRNFVGRTAWASPPPKAFPSTSTSKKIWRREAPRDREEPVEHTNGPASPSPVTDGSNVHVFFGDFGLLSYGPEGKERWRLPLGPFNNVNGHGSSPILANGKLVLICDQDTGSYLLAVDAVRGRVMWKTMRPEYTRGYATPAVYQPKNGPAELIVPGSFEPTGPRESAR